MTAYVDRALSRYGRMRMSHLLADTEEELHAMAQRVGLKREWFQSHSTPHYDLCMSKRREAIKAGAVEIDRKQVVELIRRLREEKQVPIKLVDPGWIKMSERAYRQLLKHPVINRALAEAGGGK